MTTYYTAAETAKLVRQSLKEAFPGVKFSVRSDRAIRIGYTDGPTVDQVESVVARFAGSYFDSGIDYQGSVYAMHNGKPVKFGASFIFVNREYTDRTVEKALQRVAAKLGGMITPTVEDYRQGRLYGWQQSGGCDVQREVGRALARHTFTLTRASKTAGSVFVTHDDGYSRSSGSGHSAVSPD